LEELRSKQSHQVSLNTELNTLEDESKSFKDKIHSLGKLLDSQLISLEGQEIVTRPISCFNMSDCNELTVAGKIHDSISSFGTVLFTQNSTALKLPNPSEYSSPK
jgi:hypothetical protein